MTQATREQATQDHGAPTPTDHAPRQGATRAGSSEAPVLDAHVLIVDDDERIRALLKKLLVRSGYRVTEARDAAHARRLAAMLSFDILVVDVMMPGEDGLSFTRWINRRTPVLLLTARGDSQDRIEGLEAGADDYLPKPFEPRELQLRIEAILRRSNAAPSPSRNPMVRLGGARFDIERGELWRGEEEVRLTTAEVALMRLLAKRMNEPVSRMELLSVVGGEADGRVDAEPLAQERAIDVQITRLRRKVEETPKAPRFIKTVRGAGYMLSPDPDR